MAAINRYIELHHSKATIWSNLGRQTLSSSTTYIKYCITRYIHELDIIIDVLSSIYEITHNPLSSLFCGKQTIHFRYLFCYNGFHYFI